MSTIQVSAGLIHLDSQINLRSAVTEVVGEDAFISGTISVSTAAETLSYGDIVSVGTLFLNALEGSDDLLVSIDGGSNFPFRLKANQGTVFRLNSESLLETTEVQTLADASGSLAGKYFDLEDRNGAVRVWLNTTAGVPEISQVVVNTAASINGKYFDLYDDVGAVRVWIDENNTGTPPATPGGGRLLEIDVSATPSVADITNAIQAALDADSKFSATDDDTDTVTITASAAGTRTDISEPDTATYFTVSVDQQGTASTTAPATPGGGRLVEATIALNATANAIATAISTAFASDAEITASAATDTVTLTNKHPGTRTDAADVDTGFTITTTQQGAASPTVQVKSTGTSTVLYGAAPF